MKKYTLLLFVLGCCIFTSMISESVAIYTHTDSFDFVVNFVKKPILNGDFIKYELSNQKICDYDRMIIGSPEEAANLRHCAQGSASYDDTNNLVNLSQDAGFFKYYKEEEVAYMVNGSFVYDTTQTPRNFGMYINGSFNQYKINGSQNANNAMHSNGYVLLFDKDGNLVINEQGVVNFNNVGDHTGDELKTGTVIPLRNVQVASQQRIAQILQDTKSTGDINLQARIRQIDVDKVFAYVYVNGILVKQEPISLGLDLRRFCTEGIYPKNIIGASTYGAHTSIKVTHLEKQEWDGISL